MIMLQRALEPLVPGERIVERRFHGQGKLGIGFTSALDGLPVRISRLIPDSQAAVMEGLQVGAVLHAVNGDAVHQRSHAEVIEMIRAASTRAAAAAAAGVIRLSFIELDSESWLIPLAEVEVGRVLGHGALGEVRQGTYKNVTVALKGLFLLRSDHAAAARMGGVVLSAAERRNVLTSFMQECKLLRQAVHQNVLPFIGVVVDQEPRYLATQYVPHGTLSDLIYGDEYGDLRGDDGCLPLQPQLVAGGGIFSALAFLATIPIMHRDIKPPNILVVINDDRKLVKVLLADFGEAKQITRTMTMVRSIAGTPLYMAPEMREGDAATTVKADVFSAGVVVVEMGSGNPPNPGPEMRQRLAVPEEERRAADLAAVRHPMILAFARNCIVDNPDDRATAEHMMTLYDEARRDEEDLPLKVRAKHCLLTTCIRRDILSAIVQHL